MPVDLLYMSVRCDEHAPRAVRTALCRLDGLGRVLSDAMLIASELVTNAVLHSSCTAADSLDVRVIRNGRLRLCVLDPGGSGRAAKITQRPTGLGGLGLRIVHQLAEDWGSHRAGQGHEVWAELPLPTT
jgi:serine/threonine-protein kinase RsbW